MIDRRFAVAGLLLAWSVSTEVSAGPYSDAVLADNPLAYYRLDETSLPTATNIGSATGIDGTYLNLGTDTGAGNIGQPGPIPGDIAGGFVIDGFENENRAVHTLSVDSEDFPVVSVAEFDGNPLDITGALTLEAWVRRDAQTDGGGNNEGIVAKYWGSTFGSERAYVLYYDPNPGVVGLSLSDTGSFNSNFAFTTETDIPLGEWVHLAATFEPATRSAIYVNGELAAERTSTTNVPSSVFNSAADFWIGKQFDTGFQTLFEGRIDEVSVYNQALTAAQIAAHFDAATTETPTSFGWNVNSSGDWNIASNWTLNTIPNSNQQTALFGAAINTPRVVFTNSTVTINGLQFTSDNKYAIAGTGGINLEADSGNVTIDVSLGPHEIQTPVTLISHTDLNGTEGSLDFNGELNIGGNTLSIQSGSFSINHSVVASPGGMIENAGSLGTAGSTTFGGDLISTGTLDIDIAGTGTDEFDFFDVAGTATVSGLLDVELVDGFTLQGGESFTVLTAGTLVAENLMLTGSAASMLQLTIANNSLIVATSLPVPGDYNGNGIVDAADYTLFRDHLGTDFPLMNENPDAMTPGLVDDEDYDFWKANYGSGSGSASGAPSAVPEPTTLTSVILAAFVWFGFRRREVRAIAIASFLGALSTSTVALAQYSSAVLGDNPIAYYRLDETTGFFAANSGTGGAVLEGAFNQLFEGNGPGNIGQPGPRPGDIVGGLMVDGFTANNNSVHFATVQADFARVEVPDNPLLDITGALTLEAWVNRDEQTDGGGNEGILAKYLGAGSARAYNLYYAPASGVVGFVISPDGTFGNAADFTTTEDLPMNEWTHLAATFEPSDTMSTMNIFVNGQLAATQTTDVTAILDSTANLWIGHQFNTSPGSTFEGRVDEAAVYDRALSAAEILEHFQAATGDPVPAFNWSVDGSASWNSRQSWSPSSVPNSNFAVVNFADVISSPQVVYVESEVTAKSIDVDSANEYFIAGVASIVLEADSGTASIDIAQGDHQFQAPIRLESDTIINVASGSLSFNNVIDLNGHNLDIQNGTVNIFHRVLPGEGGTITNSGGTLVFGVPEPGTLLLATAVWPLMMCGRRRIVR